MQQVFYNKFTKISLIRRYRNGKVSLIIGRKQYGQHADRRISWCSKKNFL